MTDCDEIFRVAGAGLSKCRAGILDDCVRLFALLAKDHEFDSVFSNV